jgi:hypothetical protein
MHETENKIRHHAECPLPNSQAELELTLRNCIVYVEAIPKIKYNKNDRKKRNNLRKYGYKCQIDS